MPEKQINNSRKEIKMNHQRLICYQLAMSMAKDMPSLICKWPRGYYYLTDQLKRALAGIVLNIAEGNGRISTQDRKRFFNIALASASEVSAIIDIALAYQLINESKSIYLQDILIQICKILHKLK